MNFILIDPLSSLARHVVTMSGLVHLNILLIYCRSFRSENVRLLLVLRLLLFSNLILPDYQNIVSFGLVCTSPTLENVSLNQLEWFFLYILISSPFDIQNCLSWGYHFRFLQRRLCL